MWCGWFTQAIVDCIISVYGACFTGYHLQNVAIRVSSAKELLTVCILTNRDHRGKNNTHHREGKEGKQNDNDACVQEREHTCEGGDVQMSHLVVGKEPVYSPWNQGAILSADFSKPARRWSCSSLNHLMMFSWVELETVLCTDCFLSKAKELVIYHFETYPRAELMQRVAT